MEIQVESVPALGVAERMKALLPVVVRRAEGLVRWMEEEDLREREGVATWRRSDGYGGAIL